MRPGWAAFETIRNATSTRGQSNLSLNSEAFPVARASFAVHGLRFGFEFLLVRIFTHGLCDERIGAFTEVCPISGPVHRLLRPPHRYRSTLAALP